MKNVFALTLAASLVAGSAASHSHHQHLHAKKHAADIQPNVVVKREPDVVTQVVAGPTETVYELKGKILNAEEAKAGLDGGDFVVVGESTPTFSAPPPPPEPTTTSAPALGAQFFESKVTTSTSAPPPPPPKPTTTSSTPPPPPPPSPSPSKPEYSEGIDSDFPSGEVDCSDFPSAWGAVGLDWLDMNGWSGIQKVPGYVKGALSIFEIHTGIEGDGCEPNSMCSYACPAGYQKAQWPDSQGSTLESIGGLYCNKDGKLELTRKESNKLCEKGQGGVFVQNDLDEVITLCRTDYPGTENMVVPVECGPGELCEVTNPRQDEFMWNGAMTSAQYYVNKKGYTKETACKWNVPEDPKAAGNWAPSIFGVGQIADGTTFLSIFPNLPTSTAPLDFNMEITGDVNSECSLIGGKYAQSTVGCTTGMTSGKAILRYF
jgi:hypothetical protein